MPGRTEKRRAAWLWTGMAKSQEVLSETTPLVHPLQGKGTARSGNCSRSYQAASRRPGFVLGRKKLAALVQALS